MKTSQELKLNSRYICLTAYKSLLLLKFLLYSPLTKQQIIDLYDEDCLINQKINIQNIRYITKSLKNIGCKIEKPCIFNKNHYRLGENPFLVNLNKNEISLLNKFKNNPYVKNDWKSILNANSLINKLCLILNNKNSIESLKAKDTISKINPDIIFKINELCKERKTVSFLYQSGFRLCNFEMIVSFLKYERGRLYVYGFSPVYQEISYIRVDKIKSIQEYNVVSPKIINKEIIRYKIFNKNYIPNENEFIVEETDKYLIIDYKIINYFHTIQDFLEKGNECEILSPEEFKNDLIEILKDIKKGYSEKND